MPEKEQQTLNLQKPADPSPAKATDSSGELSGTIEADFLADESASAQTPSAAEPQKTDKEKSPDEKGRVMSSPEDHDTGDLTQVEGVEDHPSKRTEEQQTKEGADTESPSTETDDDTRFDKHPRFKKLIKDRDEYRDRAVRAEAEAKVLREIPRLTPTVDGAGTEEQVDFEDISQMSEDDIKEKLDENPLGFLANYGRQLRYEITQELNQNIASRDAKTAAQKTFDGYAKDHPDFTEFWNNGEIDRFIKANPGHNAISAHQVLTAKVREEERQAAIDEAVEKAKKETEARVLADVKAKRSADTLGAGPPTGGVVHDQIAPELKEPKKFGGLITALAQRSKERRKQT